MFFRGSDENPIAIKREIHVTIPKLEIIGDYKMKGKMLVLPIQGSGKCNFTIGKKIQTYYNNNKKNNEKSNSRKRKSLYKIHHKTCPKKRPRLFTY